MKGGGGEVYSRGEERLVGERGSSGGDAIGDGIAFGRAKSRVMIVAECDEKIMLLYC